MEKAAGTSFERTLAQIFSGDRECLHSPTEEVQPGEVVLGTLDNDVAKSPYSFANEIRGNLLQKVGKEGRVVEIRKDSKLFLEIVQAASQLEISRQIFWEIVHEVYPASRGPTVTAAIRTDWKVVIYKSQGSSISDFLEAFGGDPFN